ATTPTASGPAALGIQIQAAIAAAAARPARATGVGPCRSESRPQTGLSLASIAAATKNVAAIPPAPAPRAPIRSGASTSRTPKTTDGSAVNQKPAQIRESTPIAATSWRTVF